MKPIFSFKLSPYFLAFLSGMMIFILEILGSRIIGPYIGSSLYVWTALITTILFFLSIGSIYGGRIADIYGYKRLIVSLFLSISLSFLFIILSDRIIASILVSFALDVRITAIILSTLLFAPSIFLLACIFPILAKKSVIDLKTDGRVLGKLSMISTYGSLFGIWICIFFLIPYIGLDGTLLLLSVIAFFVSIVLGRRLETLILYTILFIGILVFLSIESSYFQEKKIQTIDTLYSRIHIIDDFIGGDDFRRFVIDTRILSEYNIKTQDLTPYVEQKFYIFPAFLESFQDVLMLGGAGYTFPTEFVKKIPDVDIDVVEIDTKMKEVAEDFFFLEEDDNLNIIHTDARYYLNTTTKKYDVLLGDAYSQLRTVPYHLATYEAIQKKYNILKKDGVVVENIISSLSGSTSKYLQSQYFMFSQIFDEVYLYPSYDDPSGEKIQNIFLVATKGNAGKNKNPSYTHELLGTNVQLRLVQPILLTDDYAPVENMVAPMNTTIRNNPLNTLFQ